MAKKKRALLIANTGWFLAAFETGNIRILLDLGYEVHCASDFSPNIDNERKKLTDLGAIVHQIDITRKPLSIGNIRAYKAIKQLLNRDHYDILHCHTPVGGVLTRLAVGKRDSRRCRVIYTAHGFHFYKGAPLKNWLLFFPIEWVLSWWTDTLVTINKEDYLRARRCLHARQIRYIPGIGIDIEDYASKECDVKEKRRELGVGDEELMLLSVGSLIDRKNHIQVIRAMSKIKNDRMKYFIAGTGELEDVLLKEAVECKIKDRVVCLGYRTDIPELCQAADVFLMPSMQEGLSVALMEAVACRVPVIASRIRGNVELVKNRDSLFDPHNTEELAEKLSSLSHCNNTREHFAKQIQQSYSLLKKCDRNNVMRIMKRIYLDR